MTQIRQVLTNKKIGQLVITFILIFIVANFLTEWRISASETYREHNNLELRNLMVANTKRLDRCFVNVPDETYCFEVLRILGGQKLSADFKTTEFQSAWSTTYIYLSSVTLEKFTKLHDRLVTIALNEAFIEGNKDRYLPSTTEKIALFRQEIKAKYRFILRGFETTSSESVLKGD